MLREGSDLFSFEMTDEVYRERAAALAQENGFKDLEDLENQYGKKFVEQVIINEETKQINDLDRNKKQD